jgi:small GTP-binding protein
MSECNVGNVGNVGTHLAKVIVVGDPAVGKTSLSSVLSNNVFPIEYNMTIGVDFFVIREKTENKKWKLHLWDTAGQESFKSITKSYYRECAICLLVFDLTNSGSFDNLASWRREVAELNKDVFFVLVGNKSDLERRRIVSTEKAEKWAESFDMKYYEISSKYQNQQNLIKSILNDFDERGQTENIVIRDISGIVNNGNDSNPIRIPFLLSPLKNRQCCVIS